MNGASLTPIYGRLNGVTPYHPMNAEVFADWSLEAGDMVSVSRNGTSYTAPVHTTTLKWDGRQTIATINSDGNKERDAISKLSAQKYTAGRGGSGGYSNNKSLHWEMTSPDGLLHASISATESELRSEYSAAESSLYTIITQTATNFAIDLADAQSSLYGHIETTANGLEMSYSAAESELYSLIVITATNFHTSVVDTESGLQSQINQNSRSISMSVGRVKYTRTDTYSSYDNLPLTGSAGTLYQVGSKYYIWDTSTNQYLEATVDEYGNANYIKAGEIAIAINNDGSTTARINANKVILGTGLDSKTIETWAQDSKNGDGVFANYFRAKSVTADGVTAGSSLEVGGNMTVASVAQFGTGSKAITIYNGELAVKSGAHIRINGTQNGAFADLDYTTVYNLKVKPTVANNVLTLTCSDGTTVNFSKATTLTGEKSSGSGTTGEYTFTATQTNKNTTTGAYETTTVATKTIGFTATADYRLTMTTNGDATAAANAKMAVVPVKIVPYTENSQTNPDPIYTTTVTANVTPCWNAGWVAAYNECDNKKTIDEAYPYDNVVYENMAWVKFPSNVAEGDASYRMYYITSDNNTAYIRLGNTSGTPVAKVDHNKYTAGGNAVGIGSHSWTYDGDDVSANSRSSNTATVYTTGRPGGNVQASVSINMTQDSSWNAKKKTVYARNGTSANGAYVALLEVDASSVYTDGETNGYTSGYTTGALNTWLNDLTNEGVSTSGWSSQGTLPEGHKIGLSYAPYGGGNRVYREAYWTVPSFSTQSKTVTVSGTGSETVYPDTGYSGLSSVKVNYSHGGTSMTLTRGAYNSNSHTYTWSGTLGTNATGTSTTWTVYWF